MVWITWHGMTPWLSERASGCYYIPEVSERALNQGIHSFCGVLIKNKYKIEVHEAQLQAITSQFNSNKD